MSNDSEIRLQAVTGFILWTIAILVLFGFGYLIGFSRSYTPLYSSDTIKTIGENYIELRRSGGIVYCIPPNTLHVGDTVNLID